jgi:23S rRNA-/tRNA-specific pseudouridylate synthase
VARTGPAFQALRGQFESGSVVKEYRAASQAVKSGSVPEILSLESRFAPSGPGRRKVRLVLPGDEKKPMAREAAPGTYLTEARIEARVEAGGTVRVLLAVTIRRGFRHQVRAHLSHLGFPIVGDPLYGVPAPPDAPQRMYLHATGITLVHPFSGELLRIVSPLPDEFRAVVQEGSGPFFSGGRGMVPNT